MKKEVLVPDVMGIDEPTEPTWENAKRYAKDIRQGAEGIVKLGLELVALRTQWFAQGARNDMDTSGQGVLKLPKDFATGQLRKAHSGWQAKVKEELGISHRTAERWIERAGTIRELQKLKSGKAIEYTPNGRNTKKVLEPTPEVIERVDEALDKIVMGVISASRGFAGVVGEGARRTSQNGIAHKAPTNHAKNLRDGLAKLRTSLPQWSKLPGDVRIDLEDFWRNEVVHLLPETFTHLNPDDL